MIEFRIEWQPAPGVRDPLLSRTWARLEVLVEGRHALHLLDSRASSVRHGVYGSVLPLASWVVENWWSLLHEHAVSTAVFGGARAVFPGNQARHHDWIRRHNLLFSREGNALPDMSLFRDEDRIFVCWVPDPRSPAQGLRFIDQGSARLLPDDVRRGLATLVEVVLERLSGEQSSELEVLRSNWEAILRSEQEEPTLCQSLAALGEDPYDPQGIDDEITALIEERIEPLSPLLREDLLNATSRRSVGADCERVAMFVDRLGAGASVPDVWKSWEQTAHRGPWAHDDGYRRASQVRQELGMAPDEPIRDLPGTIEKHFGSFQYILLEDCPRGSQVDGLLGLDAHGTRTLIAAKRRARTDRFLIARSLHHWLYTIRSSERRLLTYGHGWEQRASRAFAAELLAPAVAIQQRLDEEPDIDETLLAEEFEVSPMVIGHQMENHRLL